MCGEWVLKLNVLIVIFDLKKNDYWHRPLASATTSAARTARRPWAARTPPRACWPCSASQAPGAPSPRGTLPSRPRMVPWRGTLTIVQRTVPTKKQPPPHPKRCSHLSLSGRGNVAPLSPGCVFRACFLLVTAAAAASKGTTLRNAMRPRLALRLRQALMPHAHQ